MEAIVFGALVTAMHRINVTGAIQPRRRFGLSVTFPPSDFAMWTDSKFRIVTQTQNGNIVALPEQLLRIASGPS